MQETFRPDQAFPQAFDQASGHEECDLSDVRGRHDEGSGTVHRGQRLGVENSRGQEMLLDVDVQYGRSLGRTTVTPAPHRMLWRRIGRAGISSTLNKAQPGKGDCVRPTLTADRDSILKVEPSAALASSDLKRFDHSGVERRADVRWGGEDETDTHDLRRVECRRRSDRSAQAAAVPADLSPHPCRYVQQGRD